MLYDKTPFKDRADVTQLLQKDIGRCVDITRFNYAWAKAQG